jgi:FkbM family methyltransferase
MTSSLLFPSLRRRVGRRLRNIFSLNPKSAYSAEQVEGAEFEFYEKTIRPGMTIFDVGSNVGSTAEYFAKKVAPFGVVHCFEPGTYAYQKLWERMKAITEPVIRLNNSAVGDRDGTTEFHVYPESHSSWNSVGRRPLENYGIAIKPVQVISVPIITLDAYCADNFVRHIDLLKLDLEGCELQALRGAKELLLQRRVATCMLEFGQTTFDQGNSPRDLVDFCRSVGYRLRNLIKGDPLFPGGRSASTAQFAMLVVQPEG